MSRAEQPDQAAESSGLPSQFVWGLSESGIGHIVGADAGEERVGLCNRTVEVTPVDGEPTRKCENCTRMGRRIGVLPKGGQP